MFKHYWHECTLNFGFDTRSISLFRITISLVIISNFYTYLYWSKAFLAPDGLVQLSQVQNMYYYWSIFNVNPSLLWQQIVLLIGILTAICLLMGYKTRLCTILLLLINLSLEYRALPTGGTVGIRMALVWGLFLPLAGAWSFSKTEKTNTGTILSGGTIGFTLQMIILYVAAAAHKHTIEWQVNYSAVYKSLWWGGLSQPLGEVIRQYPALTIMLTRVTYWLEWLGPMLLINPFFRPTIRTIGTFLFIGMHLSFQATMSIEPYPYANTAIMLLFLPSEFWQTIRKQAKKVTPLYWRWSYWQVLPLVLITLLLWKNAWHFDLLPKPINFFYRPLATFRLTEKWNMFAGGTPYFRFWPAVKGELADGTIIDPWRWYIGLKPTYTPIVEPGDVSKLTPNLRWDKLMTNLMRGGDNYNTMRQHYLEFLCKNYNASHANRMEQITLQWGYQEILDFNVFGSINTADIATKKCRQ